MYGRTFDFGLKSNNELPSECTAVNSILVTKRITNYLLNVRPVIRLWLNSNNQLPAECTAVYSILVTNRRANYLLDARPVIRLCCQAVTSNNLLDNHLPTTCQLHAPLSRVGHFVQNGSVRGSANGNIGRFTLVPLIIMLTCLCNEHPLTPHFYSEIGVNRGIHYFLLFALKHRSWVLVRTATTMIYVLIWNKKSITFFSSENHHFYSRELLQYITRTCLRNCTIGKPAENPERFSAASTSAQVFRAEYMYSLWHRYQIKTFAYYLLYQY